MTETPDAHQKPEIVVALVGAAGTEMDLMVKVLTDSLAPIRYGTCEIRISELLREIKNPPWEQLRTLAEDERYQDHMDAGNQLRERFEQCDALARFAVAAIRERREERTGDKNVHAPGTVYVIRSLKTPAEVKCLRKIYGWRFVLIAGYCSRNQRVDNLAKRIAESHNAPTDSFRSHAEWIANRDQSELEETRYGQNVRETFPMADIFVDASDRSKLERSIKRAVELYFGHPFHTPTQDEYGMFHAYSDSLRSASLGRQVGAAIATSEGEVVVMGTNEVPRFGGGQYWPDADDDRRDHILGYDPSDKLKRLLVADVLTRLQRAGWLATERASMDVQVLVEEALRNGPESVLKGSQAMSIIEFVRPVHAEMAAIVSAARRGVAVNGCTMYVTTFPCHECARHIVAAGILRVVYIEPYPKSRAPELYHDSIAVDQPGCQGKVSFEPFVGIAPSRYFDSFSLLDRKKADGAIVDWIPHVAKPRNLSGSEAYGYIERERQSMETLESLLTKKGILLKKP